jgi:hypothetical protein
MDVRVLKAMDVRVLVVFSVLISVFSPSLSALAMDVRVLSMALAMDVRVLVLCSRVLFVFSFLSKEALAYSDQTASSFPFGSTKWNRRPPGKA